MCLLFKELFIADLQCRLLEDRMALKGGLPFVVLESQTALWSYMENTVYILMEND